jgi:radical SAM protein with 4Fe4S-binding SPASM domain
MHKELMTWDTFTKVVEQIKELDGKLKVINYAGWGSPLMSPILSSMIRYLKIADVAENIAVITNGLFLTPKTSRDLIDAGCDHIRISVQGMDSEQYLNVSSRKIDFNQFIENITWLYAHKKNCKVSVKIADVAIDESEESLFYETFENISDQMYVEHIRPMFPQNIQDGKCVSKYGHEHPHVGVCPLPFYMMSVKADGNILPCCSYSDPTNFGNIHNTTLKKVWESEEMKDFWKWLLETKRTDFDFYPVCTGCLMPDAILTPGDYLDDRAVEIRGRM